MLMSNDNELKMLKSELVGIDVNLILKVVQADDTVAQLKGDFVELEEKTAGDIEVFYGESRLLRTHKIDGIPAVDLDVTCFNNESAIVMSRILAAVGKYLPDGKDC